MRKKKRKLRHRIGRRFIFKPRYQGSLDYHNDGNTGVVVGNGTRNRYHAVVFDKNNRYSEVSYESVKLREVCTIEELLTHSSEYVRQLVERIYAVHSRSSR